MMDTSFLGSKITADCDYNHEMKRCLFLRKEGMTNLDSILKSRDIPLLTKVLIDNAVVFPVVVYDARVGLTRKKADCHRIDAFKLCCWRRPMRVPWAAGKSNQSIIEEINPEYSLEGLMLKLKHQYSGHLM